MSIIHEAFELDQQFADTTANHERYWLANKLDIVDDQLFYAEQYASLEDDGYDDVPSWSWSSFV